MDSNSPDRKTEPLTNASEPTLASDQLAQTPQTAAINTPESTYNSHQGNRPQNPDTETIGNQDSRPQTQTDTETDGNSHLKPGHTDTETPQSDTNTPPSDTEIDSSGPNRPDIDTEQADTEQLGYPNSQSATDTEPTSPPAIDTAPAAINTPDAENTDTPPPQEPDTDTLDTELPLSNAATELDALAQHHHQAMADAPSWADADFTIPERSDCDTKPAATVPWMLPLNTVEDVTGTAVQATGLRQRKPETDIDYLRRVRYLQRMSSQMRTLDPEQPHHSTPVDVVDDLILKANVYTVHTWLLYRSALLWYLASQLNRFPEPANSVFASAYKKLAATRAKPGVKDPRPRIRSAATNMRGIPRNDFLSVLNELSVNRRHRVNWSSRVAIYLQASISAGLRPGEWCSAAWLDDNKTELQVVTLKTKQTIPDPLQPMYDVDGVHPRLPNDTTPRIRTVPISNEDRLMVDLHLENIRMYMAAAPAGTPPAERYKTYYEYCRRALDRTCRRLWQGTKSYSLYDARHQFAANCKAEMELEEVARLLGHDSTRSTTVYASKAKAWNKKAGS